MRLLSLIVLTCILTACAPFEAVEEKGVRAHVDGSNLFLTNKTQARAYYFVTGRQTAALILWAPQLQPENSIAPDATAKIPYDQILRAEEEAEVIVYWWHAIWKEERYEVGEVHSFIARL